MLAGACIVAEGGRWRCLRRGTPPLGPTPRWSQPGVEVVVAWVEQHGSRSWRVRYRRQGSAFVRCPDGGRVDRAVVPVAGSRSADDRELSESAAVSRLAEV